MIDRVRIIDDKLKQEIDKVDWSKFLLYGSVKVQIRQGKPVMITKEETVKLD